MRDAREFLGYVLAAALVVGGVLFFALPASAQLQPRGSASDDDWTSEPPYHWSITNPTKYAHFEPHYDTDAGVVYKREGRHMVRMSPVEIERDQNVRDHVLVQHEELWPEPSVH